MKFHARRTLTAACLATTLLTTAACGVGGGSGSDTASKAGNCDIPEANRGNGPIEGKVGGKITFETGNLKTDFAHVFEPLIEKFEAEHPGTTVEWIDNPGGDQSIERLMTTAQSCKLPDVINIASDESTALSRAGFLMDLDEKSPGIGDPFIPNLYEASKLPGTTGHQILPWYGGPNVLVYNKALLAKAGVKTPPATLEEYFAAQEKIGAAGKGKFHAVLAGPGGHLPGEWQMMDVKIMNGERTAFTFGDDPQALKWLTEMRKLYAGGAMPKDSLDAGWDSNKAYASGTLAFGSPAPSFLRYAEQNAPAVYKDTAVAPYFKLPDGKDFSVYAQFVTVPSTSKNAVTALAFAKFLLSPENQTAFSKDPKVVIFPSTTESLKDPFFTSPSAGDLMGEARKIAGEELANAGNTRIWQFNKSVKDAIYPELARAIQGKGDPAAALKTAEDKANKALAASGLAK